MPGARLGEARPTRQGCDAAKCGKHGPRSARHYRLLMCAMDLGKRAGMPHPATPPGLPPRDCRHGAHDLTLHSNDRTQGGADAFDPNQPYCHPDRPGRGGAARASRTGAGCRLLRRQDHRTRSSAADPAAATTSMPARSRAISAATSRASPTIVVKNMPGAGSRQGRALHQHASRPRTAPRWPASCRARSSGRCSTTAPSRCSIRPRCTTSAPPTAARASA